MATTIPAGTLRLLLTSISYRAKARKRDAARAANGSAPPAAPLLLDCPAGLTPQQLRRVCTADPAGLAWSVICCTVWHRSITGVRPYIHYYNGAAVLTCTAPRRGGGIWYRCGASGRFDTLQRGAGGIIAACVGLVSRVVE